MDREIPQEERIETQEGKGMEKPVGAVNGAKGYEAGCRFLRPIQDPARGLHLVTPTDPAASSSRCWWR